MFCIVLECVFFVRLFCFCFFTAVIDVHAGAKLSRSLIRTESI